MHLVSERHIPTGGCYQRIECGGDITAGFRLDADVMPDTEYTFVHLTKYRDPATHLRIWQSDANFISGFHGNGASIYHECISSKVRCPTQCMELTIDQRSVASMVENWKGGTKKEPLAKSLSTQYLTSISPMNTLLGHRVLLYEGNLDGGHLRVEAYFAESTA
jgi:hypothetical protein